MCTRAVVCSVRSPHSTTHNHPTTHTHHTQPNTPQGYGDQRFVFEGVGGTIRYGPGDRPFAAAEARVSALVFIGRNLDRRALTKGFRCVLWVCVCVCILCVGG